MEKPAISIAWGAISWDFGQFAQATLAMAKIASDLLSVDANRSGGRVGLKETQHRLIEVPRHHLGEAVAALGEDLYLGAGDETSELLGEIVRSDDVVLRPHNEIGRGNPGEFCSAVEGQDRVDPAGDNLWRREGCESLRLPLSELLVVLRDPIGGIEEERGGL